MARIPPPKANDIHIQAFVIAERQMEAHMNEFVTMCNESKQSGRVLTFSELIDFKVKYNILMEEQCKAFMSLHLIGCKLQSDRN